MAGQEIAETFAGTEKCTLHWEEHSITFDGYNYKVFDTVGLEEQEFRRTEFLEAIENAYHLVAKLASEGGIDLLLYCIRAGRVTTTIQANYRLFYEWLCEKKVPIVLIVTGIEREDNMEDWWDRNKVHLSKYDIRVAGHASIIAVKGVEEKYEKSVRLVRDLVIEHTRGMREAGERYTESVGVDSGQFLFYTEKEGCRDYPHQTLRYATRSCERFCFENWVQRITSDEGSSRSFLEVTRCYQLVVIIGEYNGG